MYQTTYVYGFYPKSHSAAITAVVASMVTAYPDKLFQIACIILHTKKIFQLDIARVISEREVNYFKGLNPRHALYDKERISSNALPFRKKRLEEIILEYQLERGTLTEEDYQQRLQKLYHVIDESFGQTENPNEYEQFSLHRMDLRKMKLVRGQLENTGKIQLALVSNLPENLLQVQHELQKDTKNDDKYMQLFLWSQGRFENDPNKYKKYVQYETAPLSALIDAQFFQSEPCSFQIDNSILIYVSAVLLRDFEDQLDGNTVQVCSKILKKHLQTVIGEQQVCQVGDGTDAAIAALPAMIFHRERETLFDDPVTL